MTTQDVITACADLPLMQLYMVQSSVGQEIEKQKRLLIKSVTVEKEDRKVFLKHPVNGTYVCKPVAFKGRWRMWKMIPGVRGLKEGPVVVNEHSGDLDDLKIHVALGYYKDAV